MAWITRWLAAALLAAAPSAPAVPAAAGPAPPASAADLAPLAAVELPDQRGGHDRLDAHRGQPVVVVVVDARRLATGGKWAEELVARDPALQVMVVADVNESRPTTLERVREVLARRVPERARVLVDMERAWARGLGLDTAAPNLLVVDAAGALAARFRGRWSEPLAGEVAAALAALPARAAPGAQP